LALYWLALALATFGLGLVLTGLGLGLDTVGLVNITAKNTPDICVTTPNLVVLIQTVRALLIDPPEKFDPSRIASEVTQVMGTDTERSVIYDFPLTFHGNHGLSLTFEKVRFRMKKALRETQTLRAGRAKKISPRRIHASWGRVTAKI